MHVVAQYQITHEGRMMWFDLPETRTLALKRTREELKRSRPMLSRAAVVRILRRTITEEVLE